MTDIRGALQPGAEVASASSAATPRRSPSERGASVEA